MTAPIYLSINEFPGDGVTTQYEFSFAGGYINRTHIKAYTQSPDGVISVVTVTDDMFVTDFTLNIGVATAVGGKVRIYRETPRDVPLLNFADGARITERNLDLIAQQTVFCAAEAFDSGAYAAANAAEASALAAAAPTAKLKAQLVGVGGIGVLGDAEVPFEDYARLRAYTGPRTRAYVTGPLVKASPYGMAGPFMVDPLDSTSSDNGGTIIVGSDGRRWRRIHSGAVSTGWFGAVGDDYTDSYAQIQATVNYAASLVNGAVVEIPSGTYRLSYPVLVPNSKSLTIRGFNNSTKLRRTGLSGLIFDCGSTSILGSGLVIKDIFFQGPVAMPTNAIRLRNCNVARIENCVFQNQITGIESINSFAIEVTGNVFDVCTSYGFAATTKCHNAIIRRNNFFTCGVGTTFEVGSDNIVIDDNDYEYCGKNIALRDCTAVSVRGNYMEYQTLSCFDFHGTNRNVQIELNWIALGSGTGSTAALTNIFGGTFTGNTVYNQTISNGANLVAFEIGLNYKFGTGSMTLQGWASPSLLNSWVSQVNYFPVGYRKDERNMVHLRGNVTNGDAGTVLFNLPTGFRPAYYGTYGSCGSGGFSWVEVRPNGDVYIAWAPGNMAGINGISFKAEA